MLGQLFNQKFMRQVKYKRPEGFVDKFLEAQRKEEEEQQKRQKFNSSHVDRLREYKMKLSKARSPSASTSSLKSHHLNNTNNNNNHHNNSNSHGHRSQNHSHSLDREKSRGEASEGAEDYQEDYRSSEKAATRSVAFEQSASEHNENRVPLASTQRIVKVTKVISPTKKPRREESEEGFVSQSSLKQETLEETLFLNASIDCFLINLDYLVVSVICSLDEETLEVEAEISSAELAAFSTEDRQSPSTTNLSFLSEVAQEVVDNVEVRVEGQSEARLVLNLFSDEVENDSDLTGDLNKWSSISSMQFHFSNNEELSQILLPGLITIGL